MFESRMIQIELRDDYLAKIENLSAEEIMALKISLHKELKEVEQRARLIRFQLNSLDFINFLRETGLRVGIKINFNGKTRVISNVFLRNCDNSEKFHLIVNLIKKDGSIGKSKFTIYNNKLHLIEKIK